MVTSSRHGNGEQAVEEKLNSHDCPQFILEPCTHTHTHSELVIVRFSEHAPSSVCVCKLPEMACCNDSGECKDKSGPAGE